MLRVYDCSEAQQDVLIEEQVMGIKDCTLKWRMRDLQALWGAVCVVKALVPKSKIMKLLWGPWGEGPNILLAPFPLPMLSYAAILPQLAKRDVKVNYCPITPVAAKGPVGWGREKLKLAQTHCLEQCVTSTWSKLGNKRGGNFPYPI